MPSLLHDALAELLRNNPRLAAALVLDQDIELSAHQVAQECLHNDSGSTATVVDSNFSVVDPFNPSEEVEFHVDAAVLLESRSGRLLVVMEPQKDPPKPAKRRAWPAYVGIGHSRFKCDTALVVIALSQPTANSCRKPCVTGHREFRLYPIVWGPDYMPSPDDPCMAQVRVELTVLCAVTQALDLDNPAFSERCWTFSRLSVASPGRPILTTSASPLPKRRVTPWRRSWHHQPTKTNSSTPSWIRGVPKGSFRAKRRRCWIFSRTGVSRCRIPCVSLCCRVPTERRSVSGPRPLCGKTP